MTELFRPRLSYMICTSPRSGSWLLAEGLQATKLAGKPREWFHAVAEGRCAARWRLPLPSNHGYSRYIDRLLRTATTPNGVFGLKCHWYQLQQFPAKLASVEGYRDIALQQALPKLFPNLKFIWLTRRNKTRQAISLHRARQTGDWWHPDSYPDQRPKAGQTVFDPTAIEAAEHYLRSNETGWQNFFCDCRVEPLQIAYEDFVADYDGSIRRVMRYLEIPEADDVAIVPTRMKPQSDKTTDRWLKSYLDYKQAAPVASLDNAQPPRGHERRLSARWKHALAEHMVQGKDDAAIVELLVQDGAPRALAEAAVARARLNPYLRGAEAVVKRLGKTQALLSLYQSLAKLDPDRGQVPRLAGMPGRQFVRDFYAANRPVILTGLVNHWPAQTRWSCEYFKRLLPNLLVDVVTYGFGSEASTDASQGSVVPLPQFMDMILARDNGRGSCYLGPPHFHPRSPVRQLLNDVAPWPEYLNAKAAERGTWLAIEPATIATPLRQELISTMIAQISGQKRMKVVPPYEHDLVYCGGGRISEVDPHTPDFARHPKYRQATVIDVTLQPGEMLFLPAGWWHCEQTLDINITLMFTNFTFRP